MNTRETFLRTGVMLVVIGCLTAPALTALPATGLLAEPEQVAPPGAAGQGGQGLPGGATSLQEAHGDWRVACAQQNAKKMCSLSQRQTDKDTHQLMLAVELSAAAADRAEGTLILPFGLALERPITLQIDEATAGLALRVRTCLPVGCLVGLTFDPMTVALLRKGTVLTVKATADGGQDVSFKISLNGFSGALDRTASLAK